MKNKLSSRVPAANCQPYVACNNVFQSIVPFQKRLADIHLYPLGAPDCSIASC
jgi:hypothetical protein